MIVAFRVYVAVFAVGLLAPTAILPIVEPKLARSDTSWFIWGPLCVALWLCRRVSVTSIPPAQTEVGL